MDLNFGIWFIICITLILLQLNIPSGKPLMNKIYTYLCTVVASATAKIETDSKRAKHSTIKKLESYSHKMMQWSKECSADFEYCDSDIGAENSLPNLKPTKNTQTDEFDDDKPCNRAHLQDESNIQYSGNNGNKKFGNQMREQPEIKPKLDVRTIRRIQEILCNQLLQQSRFLNFKDVKTPLLICVEATEKNISGYCINFKSMTCKFYIYKNTHLPWNLDETSPTGWDFTEFKIKNLVFALLLWEQEIMDLKKYSIYSNCSAVNNTNCEYGSVAIEIMEHLGSCENIVRVNSNPQISKYRDTEAFSLLMQPARDLAFWNLAGFRNFVKRVYGIQDFESSHMFMDDYSDAAKQDGFFKRSYRYHHFLITVDKNLQKLLHGCTNCGMYFPRNFEARNENSIHLETLDELLSSQD